MKDRDMIVAFRSGSGDTGHWVEVDSLKHLEGVFIQLLPGGRAKNSF